MDMLEKVYDRIKTSMTKNEHSLSMMKIAKELNLKEHEVKEAFEALKKAGRIKITEMAGKVKMEFLD